MLKITLQHTFCLIEPQGPLTKADFQVISDVVDPIIEKDGELDGLVIKTQEFPGWETFSDVVAHFQFVRNHHEAIKKVALVTDARVAEVFPALVSHFVKAEVKHFAFDEYDAALEWIG